MLQSQVGAIPKGKCLNLFNAVSEGRACSSFDQNTPYYKMGDLFTVYVAFFFIAEGGMEEVNTVNAELL